MTPSALFLLVVAASGAGSTVHTPSAAFNVLDFGATPGDATVDDPAIQAALDAAADAGGGTVVLPCGTFLTAPGIGPARLTVGSRTVITGEGPCSVLKVKDEAGDYRTVFAQRPGLVEDVVFRDLRIDQNAAGNRTCDVRVGGAKPQFVFEFTHFNGFRLERVVVDAATGVNTVYANGAHTSNFQVSNSRFRFVPARTLDPSGTYDNSTIYVHGSDWIVSGNVFENGAAPGRARTSIEVHGARGSIAGNLSRGYRAGIHVVGESASDPQRSPSNAVAVTGNTITGANRGINLWALSGRGLRGVALTGNVIVLDLAAHSAVSHAGISLIRDSVSGNLDGDFEDLLVTGNSITMSRWTSGAYSDADSAGILLHPQGSVRNLVVTSNVIRDAPGQGIRVQSGTGEVVGAVIAKNLIADAGNDGRARTRAAIVLAGRITSTQVLDNAVIDFGRPLVGQNSLHLGNLHPSSRVEVRDNAVSDADTAADLLPVASIGAWGDLSTAPSSNVRYGPTIQPRADTGRRLVIDVSDGAPHRLEAPARGLTGQRLRLHLRNVGSGVAGALSWRA